MRTIFRISLVAILAATMLAGPALAWDENKTKAEVQTFMDQVAALMGKKDLPGLTATATPQTTVKYVDGRVWNMAQWQEEAAKSFAGMGEIASKFVVGKVWPKGKDKMGAVYLETEDFTLNADPGHKYRLAARFRVLLLKTPQGLRFLEFVELSETMTRDGKAFNPKAKPKAAPKAKTKAGQVQG